MKIEKINIQTSDKHATDIAMLVDKLDFLRELQRLREKWKITEFYPLPLTKDKIVKVLNRDRLLLFHLSDELKNWQEFNDDIDGILYQFSRGKNFKKVVIYALITGIVPEGIYKSCYFDIVAINQSRDGLDPEKYQYVIVMSPRTLQKEVEVVYKEFISYIKRKIEFDSKYKSMSFAEKLKSRLESVEIFKLIAETRESSKNQRKFKEKSKAIHKYLSSPEFANSLRKGLNNLYSDLSAISPTGDSINDIFDDVELLAPYSRGKVYPAADIDKFDIKTDIDRIREWYWIRNQEFFNGESKEQLPYPEVLDRWLDTCPYYKEGKAHDLNDPECPKCTFFVKKIRKDKRVKDGGGSYNHIEKALDTYNELLNQS